MRSDARHTGFALEETTIGTIHQAIQRRELTARELVTGYLHRIEQHDKAGATLNAVVSLNEQALLEADALDAAFNSSQQLQGALHGIPVLLKDNIDTVDIPTSYGSAPFLSHYPPADATVVTKLRAAGAVILGKTTLPDFATSWWA